MDLQQQAAHPLAAPATALGHFASTLIVLLLLPPQTHNSIKEVEKVWCHFLEEFHLRCIDAARLQIEMDEGAIVITGFACQQAPVVRLDKPDKGPISDQ